MGAWFRGLGREGQIMPVVPTGQKNLLPSLGLGENEV